MHKNGHEVVSYPSTLGYCLGLYPCNSFTFIRYIILLDLQPSMISVDRNNGASVFPRSGLRILTNTDYVIGP
jgi:hypothetical protein